MSDESIAQSSVSAFEGVDCCIKNGAHMIAAAACNQRKHRQPRRRPMYCIHIHLDDRHVDQCVDYTAARMTVASIQAETVLPIAQQ